MHVVKKMLKWKAGYLSYTGRPKKNSGEIAVTYKSEKNMGRIEPTSTTNKRGGKCSALVVSHWGRVATSPMLDG